ncbi:MAG: hypothetical protein IJN21_06565, partial [Clostridia bacterium]|nr:hypothetical protein [Clostridia bacterium]
GIFPINEPELKTAKWYRSIKKKRRNLYDFGALVRPTGLEPAAFRVRAGCAAFSMGCFRVL